ncbi:MAG: hypothetical protein Q9174_003567 [Haloplaca sp. 1 TL-2023]
MDPLSISVAIVGVCTAAIQVNKCLKGFIDSSRDAPSSARHTLAEITGIYVSLQQLDAFLSGRQESPRSRRSLVMLEQVIIIFTDCVSVFSELEQTIETLKTDAPLRVVDRMKWATKEKTILKFNTLASAEHSTRNLTAMVQQLLRSNISMSRRLRSIERMHPAVNRSRSPSITAYRHLSGVSEAMQTPEPPFQKELETSPAYRRAAFNRLGLSKTSSHATSEPLSLSGLSLSDVSNVTAIALPISSSELWNHQRYATGQDVGYHRDSSTLDAWYNPPAKLTTPKKSAFIRTVYFDGQYTNQYAQAKFTGHLIYRRFDVSCPDSPPRFREGLAISSSREREQACFFKKIESGERPELDGIAVVSDEKCQIQGSGQQKADRWLDRYRASDVSTDWGKDLLALLAII